MVNLTVLSRGGLIRARQEGAKVASADVIVFLDAHTESVIDWLRPLLHRIKEKQSAVVVPNIDSIYQNTFEFVGASASDEVTIVCYNLSV